MFNLSKFISDSVTFRQKSMFLADIEANAAKLTQEIEDLICANHSISRAELAKALKTSGRQVRKAIDALRDKKIRRKGGDCGEWDIIG